MNKKLLKDISKLLDRRSKKKIIFLFIAMFFGAIFESFSITLILPLIEAIVKTGEWKANFFANFICNIFSINDKTQYVILLLILMILLFFVKNIYLVIEKFLQYSFVYNEKIKLQKKLFNIFLNKKYEYFVNTNSAEIARVVDSDASECINVLLNILAFFTDLIVCSILAITLIVISPLMSIILILFLLVEVLILTKVLRPYLNKLGEDYIDAYTKQSYILYGTIFGIKSIMVADRKLFFNNKFSDASVRIGEIKKKNDTISSLPKILIETVSITAVLFVAIIMILIGYELSELVSIMATFAIAAMKLLPSVSSISTSMNNVVFMKPALDNVNEIINKDSNIFIHEDINNDARILFNDRLELKDICFKYQNSDKYILKNANLTIKPGDSVGIIGNSGSGKTTTVDLILGLLKPISGEILVDGINIDNNISSWLKNISYIPQNIYLLDGSIRENVAFGVEEQEISDEKIWEVLKEAQLYEFVKDLPDGIYSNVGERGSKISGGQIQRLGIARALYTNPKILVFDEATSSLDNETEKAIMESINSLKGKKTLIIIAHRLSTIEQCDYVYKVNKNKLLLEKTNIN